MIVRDSWTRQEIGAVGFIDDKLSIIVSFYEDKDANEDGKIALSERFSLFSMKGRAIAKVASQAYADPDILMRDPSLYNLRGKLLTEFAGGLLAEAVYRAYFAPGVSQVAGSIAGRVTENFIKAFLIRKGLEKTVEAAYKEAAGVR